MTTTADTRSNAQRYADSIAAEIWKWDKDGEPFGVNEYDDIAAPLSAFDYLEDALDIEYRVRARREGGFEYVGARILVGFGGPNVWIDTKDRELIVTWYSAPEVRELPVAFCDYLDSALSDLFEMHN